MSLLLCPLLGLFPTAPAQAQEPGPVWQAQCSGVAAPARPAGYKGRTATQEELRYNDPLQALSQSCLRLARGDASFAAQLDLADSLLAASRPEASASLLGSLEPLAAGQPLAAAALELSRAALAMDAGQYASAQGPVERALALLNEVQPHPAAQRRERADLRTRALLARASVVRSLDKTQGLALAQAALDEAEQLALRELGRNSYRMGDVYNQRTMLAYDSQRLDEAIRWAEAERDLVRRISGRYAPAQLDALATLAAITGQQRKFAAAIGHLEEGRDIGRRSPAASRRAYLGILESLSSTLLDFGRPAQAARVADEALALAVAGWGVGSANTVTPLERRALAEISLQHYADARRSFAEVQAILRREGAQMALPRRLRLLDSIAGFLARVGDFDAAQRLVDEGLALVPEGSTQTYWRGRLLRRAGLLAAGQSRWVAADALHAQARALLQGALGARHGYLTASDAYRCEAQLHAGLMPVSCTAVAGNLDALSEGSPGERVLARRTLALQALLQGQEEPALDHLLHALAAAQSFERDGPIWRPLDDLAGQLRQRGQGPLAVLLAKQAVRAIEAVRQRFLDPVQLNIVAQDDRQAVYRRLADWLAEDGRADEALEVFGLLKAHEFSGFVDGRSNAGAPARATLRLNAAERRWLMASPLMASPQMASPPAAAIGAARPAAAGNPQTPAPALSMAAIGLQEQQRVRAWRLALQRALPAPASEPGAAQRAPPAAGELVATLFIGPRHLNTVVSSRLGQRLLRTDIDPQQLSQDIGRLLESLARREDVLPLLQSLHRRVAAPLLAEAQRAAATRLVLRLDGDLRYLPFAALHDGKAYLVETYTVVQQAMVAGPRPAAGARPASAWLNAFGSTRAAPGLPALPGVAAEICGIVGGTVEAGDGAGNGTGADGRPCAGNERRGRLAGRGWLDAAFTQQALRQAAASGRPARLDLLHIGTHFVLRPGEIGRSWMQLGDGQRLPLDELLSWRLDSLELVTLSACQTGLGAGSAAGLVGTDSGDGGELEGLAALLLQRGAQAVIASLWAVDDRSTGELMRQLYARIAAGAEPATALRQAQLQLLADADARAAGARLHPFHWAGFYLSTAGH